MSEAQTQTDTTTDTSTTTQTSQTDATTQAAAEKPFYDTWAPELKESPAVLRHKSPEEMARSLVAAEKRLGVPADKLLRVPEKPEDFAEVWKKLGAPETAEGYKLNLGDKATDADRAMGAKFAAFLHEKGGMPVGLAQTAVDFWTAETAAAEAAALEAAKQATEAGQAALKTEWGAAYDQNVKTVGALLAKYGGAELVKELDASTFGDNPRLASALAKIAARMAEPGLGEGGDPDLAGRSMTPGEAKGKRLLLEADPENAKALRDKTHIRHQLVMTERQRYLAWEAGREPGAA